MKRTDRQEVLYTRVKRPNKNWVHLKAQKADKSVSQWMDEHLTKLRKRDAGNKK